MARKVGCNFCYSILIKLSDFGCKLGNIILTCKFLDERLSKKYLIRAILFDKGSKTSI